jgi:hypothetical protein
MPSRITSGMTPITDSGNGFSGGYGGTYFGNSCGPFAIGSYVYAASYVNNVVQMRRSTDPLGIGWTASGSALTLTAGITNIGGSAYVVGNVIHWLFNCYNGSTTSLIYANFDTSTQTWSAFTVAVAASANNTAKRCSIAVMSNGDIAIGYGQATSKTTDKALFGKRVGTTWTVGTVIDDNASTADIYYFDAMFRDPVTNTLHFFYTWQQSGVGNNHHYVRRKTISSTYVVQTTPDVMHTRSSSAGSTWSFTPSSYGMYTDGTDTYFNGCDYDPGWSPAEVGFWWAGVSGNGSVIQGLEDYASGGAHVPAPVVGGSYYVAHGLTNDYYSRFYSGAGGYPSVTSQAGSSVDGGTSTSTPDDSTWAMIVVPGTGDRVLAGWIRDSGGANYFQSIYAFGPPTVTLVDPYQVDVGGGATITGTNFNSVTDVTVGGTSVTSFTVVNTTTITAIVPAKSVGTYDVAVISSNGTSAASAGDNLTYAVLQVLSRNVTDNAPAQDAVGVTSGKYLKPDTVLQQTNTTGTVSLVNTSPAGTSDTDWMAGPGQGGGAQSVRLGFETPPSPLVTGTGPRTQTFRFRVKRSYP